MQNNENQMYTFYEYLSYFWRKKLIILILPIILIAVAIILSFFQKPTYTGVATIYIGSVEKAAWTEPDLIKNELKNGKSDFPNVTIASAGDKRINFIMSGLNKNNITSSLENITNSYFDGIQKLYDEKVKVKESEINDIKNELDITNNFINDSKKMLSSPEKDITLFETLRYSEELKSKLLTKQRELKEELAELEEPQNLGIVINQGKNFLKSNIVVAILLGGFLSLVILTFMKYIEDARRKKH
ncbi:hypothetical protein K0H71_12615 [Bacillus sp. IITD106]|nr:hypothetical protein [Bacillus sp. IITD106]